MILSVYVYGKVMETVGFYPGANTKEISINVPFKDMSRPIQGLLFVREKSLSCLDNDRSA